MGGNQGPDHRRCQTPFIQRSFEGYANEKSTFPTGSRSKKEKLANVFDRAKRANVSLSLGSAGRTRSALP